MKTYNLFLPVFKQGDDFAQCLSSNGGHPIESFLDLAKQYKLAADICQIVAKNLAVAKSLDDIEVSGDTHSIYLSMSEEDAYHLVKDSILIEEEIFEDD